MRKKNEKPCLSQAGIAVSHRPGGNIHDGLFEFGNVIIPCKLGRAGITHRKSEGDGKTPRGSFRILYGLFRPDRIGMPRSALPMRPIKPSSGWCDSPGDANYNRPVSLPCSASHEQLYREDRLYDICLILDFNITPRIQNRGSAIFFHLTSPHHNPTAGCIAIDPANMRSLLARISTSTIVRII